MLKELRIQNFAIIDQVDIEFGSGLNIISGETGAGKSIIMDALFLILGGRASSDLIRKGASEALVEACFDISGDKEMQSLLADLAIPFSKDDGDLIVRRLVQASGKNRILVNGALANATILASITSKLVDLCSQHDQQLLMRPDEQLLWVDRFGGLEDLRAKVAASYSEWSEAQKALDMLTSDTTQRSQRLDFLRFQMNELNEAVLSDANEDQALEQELKTLANGEQLFGFAAEAEAMLYGSDGEITPTVMGSIGTLVNKVKSLQAVDPRLNALAENLESLRLYATEVGLFIREYSLKVERNEERLEEIHARLSLLGKLKRKYGPTLTDVIQSREQFSRELSSLENHDQSLADSQAALQKALTTFEAIAKDLRKKREKAAKAMADATIKELADLQMDRARFVVDFETLPSPSPTGLDQIRFQIAANPGEPLGLLQKVASGGELSRVMLAIHNVISSLGGVGVYLFDEVDAGIGGKTAAAVGAKIAKVSRAHQVICITHLAQVACFADHHLRVEKETKKRDGQERTIASVTALQTESEKVAELSRMLAGLGNDATALANAKSMRTKAKEVHSGKSENKASTAKSARRPAERSL